MFKAARSQCILIPAVQMFFLNLSEFRKTDVSVVVAASSHLGEGVNRDTKLHFFLHSAAFVQYVDGITYFCSATLSLVLAS